MIRLPVKIRLNQNAYEKYENLAAAKNQTLASFIREKLEDELAMQTSLKNVETKLSELNFKLNEASASTAIQENSSKEIQLKKGIALDPVLTEIVLLLRGIARPDHMNMVHGELRRQGLDVFSIVN